jgi:hypothetical protein
MKIDTNYIEIMTMFYLSKLIYDYHENDNFHLNLNETIKSYIIRITKEYENGINNHFFVHIKNALLFLVKNYPNSKMYKYIYNDAVDIQSSIIINNNSLTVIFKGTDSLIDCYYDLHFIKRHINLDNIEVHKGFFNQLMSIYNELLTTINSLLLYDSKFNIYITGHSAGSGHGTIFTYLLAKLYPNKILKLITFAGPKVGNYEWQQSFNSLSNILHYRITNEGDIITKIPNVNYYHVGINIHLTKNNVHVFKDYACCDDEYCENECCLFYNDCIFFDIISKFKYLNIDNHKIDSYYLNLINKEEIFNDLISKQYTLTN